MEIFQSHVIMSLYKLSREMLPEVLKFKWLDNHFNSFLDKYFIILTLK